MTPWSTIALGEAGLGRCVGSAATTAKAVAVRLKVLRQKPIVLIVMAVGEDGERKAL